MNRWRVGEDRGSKEKDRCPLTVHNLGDWDEMSVLLHRWHWGWRPLVGGVDILSVALYDLFRADSAVFIYSLY
jgi:hypothetical protein